MTFDLEPIKRLEEAATPGPWKSPWTEDPTHATAIGDVIRTAAGATVLGMARYGGDSYVVVLPADAEFMAHAREAVPALIAEVERLTDYLTAILDHGSTMWADSSCGRGSAGGQTITSTAHGEVVQHLVQSALQGVTVKEAADAYAEWVPGTSRLDEPAKRPRRAGPDGRPV